jgi:hypothetical protein
MMSAMAILRQLTLHIPLNLLVFIDLPCLFHLTYAQILSWSETTKGKDHLETLEILS